MTEQDLDHVMADQVTELANAIEGVCAGKPSTVVHIALAMVFGAGLSEAKKPDAVLAGFWRVVQGQIEERRRAWPGPRP